jgi:hypothetical protein
VHRALAFVWMESVSHNLTAASKKTVRRT